jgi:predicted transposase YbfD/YdcC
VGQAALATRSVTCKKTGEVKTGNRIFLSSLPWEPGTKASLAIGSLVRRHWVVENNIHWLRDGVWKEDTSRSRSPNAACALALLRTALLAPVRASGHTSLTTALESFAENKAGAVALIRNQRLA